jgi:pimeloyl-ACP methyl ester carboxylesterase
MPYLTINDFSMFYDVCGEGRAVLLIHGLGSDHRGWEYQENDLKSHFQLVNPDLRGHGQSRGGTTDFVPARRFAEDLDTLLSHLHLNRAHVIGESMGGIIALEFVLDFPERVDRLVLVDTTPRVTEETADVVYSWREAQLAGGNEAFFRASLASGFSPQWIKENPEIVEHLRQKAQSMNAEGVVAAGLGLATTDLSERLSEIAAPTLVIHGDSDRIINIEMGRLMNRGIKNSGFKVLKGCGHSPTVQKAKELNRLLISFLSS